MRPDEFPDDPNRPIDLGRWPWPARTPTTSPRFPARATRLTRPTSGTSGPWPATSTTGTCARSACGCGSRSTTTAGEFSAVEIDCELGVITPDDVTWADATRLALCAATNHLSLVRHFTWVHLATAAQNSVATRNSLPADHRLLRLLWPHMWGTQYSNELVTKVLLMKGGDFDRVCSASPTRGCAGSWRTPSPCYDITTFDPYADVDQRGLAGAPSTNRRSRIGGPTSTSCTPTPSATCTAPTGRTTSSGPTSPSWPGWPTSTGVCREASTTSWPKREADDPRRGPAGGDPPARGHCRARGHGHRPLALPAVDRRPPGAGSPGTAAGPRSTTTSGWSTSTRSST